MAREREPRQDGLEDLVVVGDNHGRVAVGYGKANEVPPAVEKATKDAQETLKRQKRVSLKGDSIPHRVIGRFGASKVIMVPAGPGTGVKAGPGGKGQYTSAGANLPFPVFEGGQMQLFRRIPKRGFSNARFQKEYLVVN